MDLANTLIRSVARAFYETKHVLVVDALMVHSALRDDDLAHLLGMQTKELRKLCAKLEEHRLLAVHNRQETREGAQRPITKTYYYVNYRQTLDAIKYRIYRLGKEVESMIKPTEEKKDYFCPRCRSQWTALEVLDSIGPQGFLCHKCGGLLERDESAAGDRSGHEKQSKLNSQLKPLLDLLPQIDDVYIPDSSFEKALSVAVPVARDQRTNPMAASVPVDGRGNAIPTAVKGLAQTTAQQIEVKLTSTDEKSQAEKAAEVERKAALAKQNVLPVWISRSTVTAAAATGPGESQATMVAVDGATAGPIEPVEEDAGEEKRGGEELNDELASYYQLMAQEKEKEALRERLDDGEEDEDEEDGDGDGDGDGFGDDDEGDFEDVVAPGESGRLDGDANTNANTNATTSSTSTPASTNPGQAANGTASSGGRPVQASAAKRIKLESGEAASGSRPVDEVERKDSEEDEGEEEDEAEFEDV